MATVATSNQHRCCCRGEKVGVCPNSRCERNVCVCSVSLCKVCVVVTVCHWYHGTSSVCVYVCECFLWLKLWLRCKQSPPCGSLIGWMTGRECDGRSAINFPVVGKGHRVTALWSTIKRTRQIGWGAPVRGRARRAGPDKDGDGDAASHNSGLDKRPATARWHHSNTSTHTQPHWHAHKHQRCGFLVAFTTQSCLIVFFWMWRQNISVRKFADDTQVYVNLSPEQMQVWGHPKSP